MAIRACGSARWAFKVSEWRPSMEELMLACSCIQEEEKQRLAKFVFREDFNSSLMGRLMMRKFIADATAVPYDAIILRRDEKGKPFWSNPSGSDRRVDFNVSHQGDYCVLAGCVPQERATATKIGVDIMKMEYTGGKPLSEFFRLMTRNFSQSEWACIKSRKSNEAQLGTFMRHWCLKESYVKNIGVGITVDLQKISFLPATLELSEKCVTIDTKVFLDGNYDAKWKFEESLIDSQHCVAVSLLDTPVNYVPVPFERISFEQLMDGAKALLEIDEIYSHNIQRKEYKS
uniref:L-aminoadipate-semialdehyde dehydrogenase-phosphopantetheinyl transferase n=1 Tax=Lutzomyia longipalpis TaxID=7200 RepID=A0A7G3ACK6_LUTLO